MATTLGALNPLRYRGYVYDTETGLYYLQNRYYDPEVGRFINSDILVSTGQGLLDNNMFAYCRNNPASVLMYLEPLMKNAIQMTPVSLIRLKVVTERQEAVLALRLQQLGVRLLVVM